MIFPMIAWQSGLRQLTSTQVKIASGGCVALRSWYTGVLRQWKRITRGWEQAQSGLNQQWHQKKNTLWHKNKKQRRSVCLCMNEPLWAPLHHFSATCKRWLRLNKIKNRRSSSSLDWMFLTNAPFYFFISHVHVVRFLYFCCFCGLRLRPLPSLGLGIYAIQRVRWSEEKVSSLQYDVQN